MELITMNQFKLHPGTADVEDWIERYELWYSTWREVKNKNQSAFFLTVGGRPLYSVMKILAFPSSRAPRPFDGLKALLLSHVVPVSF